MKIAITLSTILLVALAGENSRGATFDDYQRFRKGTYDFAVETQYFKSEANYRSSGDSYQGLPAGQSFDLMNLFLKTRYDLSKRSSVYGALNVAMANSVGFDAKRSNSGLGDARLGYAYLLYSDEVDIITDYSILIPLTKASDNTDTVMNAEGVIEGGGLLRAQKDYSSFVPYGYVGGWYRQNRSALLPWGVGAEIQWVAFTLGGKLFGYQTIMDDPDTAKRTQRLIVNDRVNGGSLKFNSVNPSVMDAEGYVKFRIGNTWQIAAGGGSTISGSAMAAGYHAGVEISYSWDSQPSYYLRPDGRSTTEDNLSSERKVPRFREETNDGVDQKIFEKKGTPVPANDTFNIKRVRPKLPVEQESTGGEMQLKLKKSKRRN